jgi:arginine decarboxylase
MADRNLAGTVTVEVATLADEFVWLLDDVPDFLAGRAIAAIERYVRNLLPPFAAALARYDRDREYSSAAPGHQGGVAFLKSPVGRAFFDFYGENLFRTDLGIERAALGSMLATRPVGERRYAARVFSAALTRFSMERRPEIGHHVGCVGDAEIALCDRSATSRSSRAFCRRRYPGLPKSHAIATGSSNSSGEARARGDREDDSAQPTGRGGFEQAPSVRGTHELHI